MTRDLWLRNTGTVATVACGLMFLDGLTEDSARNEYVPDSFAGRIYRIGTDGIVSPVE